MKKYLYSALALPLLFACSSDDLFEKEAVSNDQFAGIEKVDATFSMDEGLTRLDNGSWNPQEGDLWGFAWMGDGGVIANNPADGKAYQNHNLIQTSGIFTPQTSIYVGKYYIYRPYDKTTVSPQAINFNSLAEQTLAEGYASTTQAWKDLAKTAINIGDKWTEVIPAGHVYGTDPTVWDKPGIGEHYKLYAAMFSNQTGLDLTYKKNNPTFAAATPISGATDINHTFAAGTAIGAADIYKVTVDLDGAAKSFTYAPTAEPCNGADHSGSFWADKSATHATFKVDDGQNGFDFTAGAITLTPKDAVKGISTGDNESKAWFWFNSLPVTAGNGALATNVQTVLTTSYGVVTVDKTIEQCAYVFEKPDGAAATDPNEWIKLAAATDQTKSPKEWALDATHNTFVNQYGNHKGKYAFDVDFSTGVMDGMHIKSDEHLRKLLKYYLASGKGDDAILLLDKDEDNEFKISKISIALIQTIQNAGHNVKVKACDAEATHTPAKIVITQDGQAALGLTGKTEVPALNNVFAVATNVYLSKKYTWTWSGRSETPAEDYKAALTVDDKVTSITNEGTLTVNATNVELSVAAATLANAQGATMNITKVTTVKNDLTNLGVINVGSKDNKAAELRAYNAIVTNDATGLKDATETEPAQYGIICNYGVVGSTAGTTGEVHNYGYIKMMNNDAITLLKSNETAAADFNAPFALAPANKMGVVELPEGNPYALVSVNNNAETGFIKYKWTAATYTHDPGNVKYNTIQVPGNKIEFTGAPANPATEIQYIEFEGTRTQVINPTAADNLPNLKGIYVHEGKSIIIEKTNQLVCSDGAYLGKDATVYLGGIFTYVGTDNYYGAWSTDQIVEY